jgi:hypothetical protein
LVSTSPPACHRPRMRATQYPQFWWTHCRGYWVPRLRRARQSDGFTRGLTRAARVGCWRNRRGGQRARSARAHADLAIPVGFAPLSPLYENPIAANKTAGARGTGRSSLSQSHKLRRMSRFRARLHRFTCVRPFLVASGEPA